MTITAVKRVLFEEASSSSDWAFPYKLIIPDMIWDTNRDQVVLGMSPDAVTWDDYGIRSRTFPPTSTSDTAPWFQAASDDGSGVVTLLPPNLIDILVPWNTIRMIGPGTVNVGVQYRDKLTGARRSLLSGRLPLVDTVI